MEDEQASLRAAFPMFLQVIQDYTTQNGAHLDFHIGITTTDHGGLVSLHDDGQFIDQNRSPADFPWIPYPCNFPGGRKYLQSGDPDITALFACAASIGTGGSGFEMELEGARLALTDRIHGPNPTNAGFLREDALLAIVMLTDENDCSTPAEPTGTPDSYCSGTLEPTHNYVTAFDAVKGGERGRWATAIIAIPPGAGSCAGVGSSENVRLKAFADEVGANAVFSNLCTGNMPQALKDAFDTFSTACENIPPVN
jgi:hypothetical protein